MSNILKVQIFERLFLTLFIFKCNLTIEMNKNKKQIILTESELKDIITETINEYLEPKCSAQIISIVNQIKDFEDNNASLYQDNSSKAAQDAQMYISKARDFLSRAAFALRSLGH